MAKRIGIGMLGAGFMGKAHTNAFRTIPYIFYPLDYQVDLVAMAAATQQEADTAMDRYGYTRGYAGWEALVSDPDVTIFDNGGPDPLHFAPVMAAIQNGKHILCEKPLAMCAEQAKKMFDAAEAKGVKHMTNFTYRFFPANIMAKRLIDSGALGKICHFHGSYTQPCGTPENLPYEEIWYNNTGKADGVGQAIGTHVIDMSRFLLGEVASIMGSSRIYVKQRLNADGKLVSMEGEEGMLGLVDFISGATGVYEALEMAAGRCNTFMWEVFGSDGSLEWNLENPNTLRVFLRKTTVQEVTGYTDVNVTQADVNHPYANIWWPQGHCLGWEHGHIHAIKHFLDCVAHDQSVAPLGASFWDGYRSEVVLEALRASSREGRRIDVSV